MTTTPNHVGDRITPFILMLLILVGIIGLGIIK